MGRQLAKLFCLPSEEGSTLYRKNLLPLWAVFPFRIPFQKGLGLPEIKQEETSYHLAPLSKIVEIVPLTTFPNIWPKRSSVKEVTSMHFIGKEEVRGAKLK